MLELEHAGDVCPSGRRALCRATLSLPSLLLWLAGVLSVLLPAPCALAQAAVQHHAATHAIADTAAPAAEAPSASPPG